jgi:hypothetical protein
MVHYASSVFMILELWKLYAHHHSNNVYAEGLEMFGFTWCSTSYYFSADNQYVVHMHFLQGTPFQLRNRLN